MRGEAVAVLIGVLVAASGVAAQTGGSVSETMELTDQPPPGASASGSLFCSDIQVHGLAEPGEGPEQTTKAYTSPSSWTLACPTLFQGPVPGAFNVSGPASAHLFIGCDQATAMHEPLNDVLVELTRNGQAISSARNAVGALCSPDAPMEVEIELDQPEEPGFNASDTVGLNVSVFGSPNAAVDNLHFVVGGNETPSTLTVPGLAEAYETEDEDPTTNTTANATEAAANGSGLAEQSTGSDENGTPGVGVAATASLLAALAVARRR